MFQAQNILSVIGLLFGLPGTCHAHGRLLDPPGRSTMWRFGYDTPINYNDNELFCGGFTRQVSNGYRCGVCGDPWDGERLNEAGGLFATGQIVETYSQGQVVTILIQITANHKGFFEFRLCPVNDPSVAATHECLDKNLLQLADGSGSQYHVTTEMGNGVMPVDVMLPSYLSCQQCVLQWRYHTGNSWGTDPDGISCIGCGDQEEFYGCADVQIVSSNSEENGGEINTPTVVTPQSSTTEISYGGATTTNIAVGGWETGAKSSSKDAGINTPTVVMSQKQTTESSNGGASTTNIAVDGWTATTRGISKDTGINTPIVVTPQSMMAESSNGGARTTNIGDDEWKTTTKSDSKDVDTSIEYSGMTSGNIISNSEGTTTATMQEGDNVNCYGVGGRTDLNYWCKVNCALGYCPASHCSCQGSDSVTCYGVGGRTDLNDWCQVNCAAGYCPASHCSCHKTATTHKAQNQDTSRASFSSMSHHSSRTPTTTTTLWNIIGKSTAYRPLTTSITDDSNSSEENSFKKGVATTTENPIPSATNERENAYSESRLSTSSLILTSMTGTSPAANGDSFKSDSNNTVSGGSVTSTTPTRTTTFRTSSHTNLSVDNNITSGSILTSSGSMSTTATPSSYLYQSTSSVSVIANDTESPNVNVENTNETSISHRKASSIDAGTNNLSGEGSNSSSQSIAPLLPAKNCYGVGGWHDIDDWCRTQCQAGYCPTSHCICPGQTPTICRATGAYASLPGYDSWCSTNCAMGFCPSSICSCS